MFKSGINLIKAHEVEPKKFYSSRDQTTKQKTKKNRKLTSTLCHQDALELAHLHCCQISNFYISYSSIQKSIHQNLDLDKIEANLIKRDKSKWKKDEDGLKTGKLRTYFGF